MNHPMDQSRLTSWLQAPPITDASAVVWALVAIAVPTAIRESLTDVVVGCEFTPFLPFVLLAAILLPWAYACGIALLSPAISGALVLSGREQTTSLDCFLTATALFLASSAAIIGAVVFIRRLFAASHLRGLDESSGGVVFSLDKQEVWAHWYGSGPPVHLGSQDRVERMMEDFLAQVEVGKRLNRKKD
jgi:hypothetical protein